MKELFDKLPVDKPYRLEFNPKKKFTEIAWVAWIKGKSPIYAATPEEATEKILAAPDYLPPKSS